MKKIKSALQFFPFYSLMTSMAMMSLLVSCVGDQGVAKNRGIVKDFSSSKGQVGCGQKYLILSAGDTCIAACETGTHIADSGELSDILAELAKAPVNEAKTTLTKNINASAGVCVADVIVEKRPTDQIDIKSDFCSCVNGKSDLISDCDTLCASKPSTAQPTLYANTIMGVDIALNSKLGNLYNWCSVQLQSDSTSPQCTLSATDGTTTIDIPVAVTRGSNSFTANLSTLSANRTWILKLVESKSSQSQSKPFQLRRKTQVAVDDGVQGALKLSPIGQYSCLSFSASQASDGTTSTKSYVRLFYYFNETPPAMPPMSTTGSLVVCHDTYLHPGDDKIDYPRLELIPHALTMWNRTDTRFVAKPENGGKLNIEKTLEDRLFNEYQISATNISLFRLLSYPNRPTLASTTTTTPPLGYIMIPFADPNTGKSYCPTSAHFNGNQPLLRLLGDYMLDTEGLYIAEKEAEVVIENGVQKVVYGTMFVRESTVLNYGFYIENGIKIRVDASTIHTKSINFYWPVSTTAEALTQGTRKTYTVRYPDTLNGQSPVGGLTSAPTTDKRIGCIPKT